MYLYLLHNNKSYPIIFAWKNVFYSIMLFSGGGRGVGRGPGSSKEMALVNI